MAEILARLTRTDSIRLAFDAEGFGPDLDVVIDTSNLGSAGARMLACMGAR